MRAWAQFSDEDRLDSLARLYYSLPDSDTAKLEVCGQLSREHYLSDSTIAWGNRLLELAKRNRNAFYKAKALNNIAWAHYQKGDYVTASGYNFQSLEIAESWGDTRLMAYNLASLGDNNLKMCNFNQADSYYKESLDMFARMGDSSHIAMCYRSMAESFGRQKMYSDANRYFKMAIAIDSILDIPELLSMDFQCLGEMQVTRFFFVITKHDMHLLMDGKRNLLRAYNLGSMDLDSRYSLLYTLSKCMHAECVTYQVMGIKSRGPQILDSIDRFQKEMQQIAELLGESKYYMGAYLAEANVMSLSGDLSKAKAALDSVAPFITGEKVSDLDLQMDYYLCSDIYYRMMGDFRNAYIEKSKYYEIQNSQLLVDYAVNSAKRVEQNRHESIIKAKEGEQEKFRHKMLLIIMGVILLAIYLALSYARKRKHYIELNQKNEQLSAQKKEIDDQNNVIKSSLNYASIIQQAVMPSRETLRQMFGEHFVVYLPLNIVSGDFYWASNVNGLKAIVSADCTGHGVPGAFVSMLGISLLNEIVIDLPEDSHSAALILETLRTKLMNSLGQNAEKYEPGHNNNKDGIDMGLVMIDYENMVAHYAGGCRPLWIVRDGKLIKYKADRVPIGMYFGEYTGFKDNVIELMHGDTLYMFSDGITDQFGYLDDERKVTKQFSAKRLAELLLSINDLPMYKQKRQIEAAIAEWENGHRQIDDINVIGVRIG